MPTPLIDTIRLRDDHLAANAFRRSARYPIYGVSGLRLLKPFLDASKGECALTTDPTLTNALHTSDTLNSVPGLKTSNGSLSGKLATEAVLKA